MSATTGAALVAFCVAPGTRTSVTSVNARGKNRSSRRCARTPNGGGPSPLDGTARRRV